MENIYGKSDNAGLYHGNFELLNLNLTYETLWTGAGSGLLISMLKKLN